MKAGVLWIAGAVSGLGLLPGTGWGAAEPPRYRFENWRVEQGLPQNTVQAILQTRDGYLWVGTRFGLGRFDGVSFTHFTIANTPEMLSDNCTALAEDAVEESLWIATDQGLLRWQNRTFTRYTTKDGLSDDKIWSLAPSRRGGVWIGTDRGLSRFVGGAVTNLSGLTEPGSNLVSHLLEDRQGSLWFNATKGVRRLDPATAASELLPQMEPPRPRFGGASMAQDHAGRVWISAPSGLGDSMFRWEDGKATLFANLKGGEAANPNKAGVRWVFESSDRTLWACAPDDLDGGLYQLKGGRLVRFPLPAWLEKETLNCLYEDREHNFWIGTATGGLVRMQPRRIRSYTREDGLPSDDIWSVCEGADGTIWVGSELLVGRVDPASGRAAPFPIRGNPSGQIRSLLETRDGSLWIGKQKSAEHSNAALFQVKGDLVTNRAPEFGIVANSIRALYQDRAGSLWVGSREGAFHVQAGQVTRYSTNEGLTHPNVRSFLEDRDGNLWMGTHGGGLNRFRNGKFVEALTTTNGLSDDQVWALHEDPDGAIWIGTGFGLNRLKNGRLFTFTRKEGLFDDLVNCILEDASGNLWISCNRGIYRVRIFDLNAVAEGKTNRVHHVAYGEGDGMESGETNGEYQPAGWKARDGRLWFPTTKGVVVIDPAALQDNELAPPVVIEQMFAGTNLVFGDKLTPGTDEAGEGTPAAPVRLPPGSARVLEIHYTANSFVAPDKMSFQFRLKPYDREWRDAGTRRVAFYTNLRPGPYHFQVQACNNHGYWNAAGAAVSFFLEPHFYETMPFYGLCALGVVLVAAGIQAYRLSVQRRLLGLEQLHALDQERDRIAQDMHDDLGANLTKIAILSEVAKRDLSDTRAAEAQVEQISTIARTVVDNISELVWATNPRNDQLDNFASFLREYAAEFFDSTPIACRLDFQVPSLPLAAELRRNLFLVVKEALHNVMKHSGATQATVTLRLEPRPHPADPRLPGDPGLLVITVTDNGGGFDTSHSPAFHNGLKNMRQRITQHGGTFELHSQPGHGTQIRIEVALT